MTTLVFDAGNLVTAAAAALMRDRAGAGRVLTESYIALSSCLPLTEKVKIGRYDVAAESSAVDIALLKEIFGNPVSLGDEIEDVVVLIRGDASDEATIKRIIGSSRRRK